VSSVILRAAGATKAYGGVLALDTVDIGLRAGEVHALIGENGAGKSTLVKILSGVLRADSGELSLDERPVAFSTPRDAFTSGIATVAQELTVFPDLTVAENLFPHNAPRRGGLLSPRRMASRAAPVLADLGLDVSPYARAGDLTLADRQLLEIGRALLQRPRVLILDEPTSALPREAVDRLMTVLRRLVERGIAVLYISHFLEEVLRLAQRVTVLRDGRAVVSGAPVSTVDLDSLVTAMLGEAGRAPERRVIADHPGPPAVTFESVSVPGELQDVSFTVSPGEVVGLAGLEGAGHLTVLKVLTGRVRFSGVARISGAAAPRSPRGAVRAGIAFVSSDRKRYGLMLDKPVWQNTSAASWLGVGRGGFWAHPDRLAAASATHLSRLRVRGGPYDIAENLSGGNQQKVVFAKWLDIRPEVVVLDDPTRGVDVGARAEMHSVIAAFATDGKPVLLASTDLLELVELCDRVLVFQRGRLLDDIPASSLSEQTLSVAMNAGFVT
jgi:ABC-type sugar transport system ATPase subunit